jgi:AAA domain
MTPATSRAPSLSSSILATIAQGNPAIEPFLPYVEPELFDRPEERAVCQVLFDYIKRYQTAPSLNQALIELQHSRDLGHSTYQEASEYLADLYQQPPQPREWLKDKAAEFIRTQSLRRSIERIDQALDCGEDFSPYLDALNNVCYRQFDDVLPQNSFTLDYFTQAMQALPEKLLFESIPQWNPAAVGRGEVGLLLAQSNAGKSLVLVHMAADLLRQGRNVLFITNEMAGNLIYQRILANLFQEDMEYVKAMTGEQYCAEQAKLGKAGELRISEYPQGVAHAGHFDQQMQALSRTQQFVPDAIIVDYLGEMSAQFAGRDAGSYDYVGACLGDLRRLGKKHNSAVWTAAQTNRSGYDGLPDLKSIADSVKSIMKADVVVGFCAIENQDAILTKILKVRNGAGSNKEFMTGVNKTTMTLFDPNDPTRPQQPDRLSQALATDQYGFAKGKKKVKS